MPLEAERQLAELQAKHDAYLNTYDLMAARVIELEARIEEQADLLVQHNGCGFEIGELNTSITAVQARNTALVEGINAALWMLISDESDDAIDKLTDVVTMDVTPVEKHRAAWQKLYERMHALTANLAITKGADALELMRLEAASIMRAVLALSE